MLGDFSVHPSLATADLGRARAWYESRLGLVPEATFEGIAIYRLKGGLFTVYETPSAGTARNTVAAWEVADLAAEMARLRAQGVVFEDYDLGEVRTVDGVARMGDGLGAWFKDADGNILGIAQPIERPNPFSGIVPVIAAADLDRARSWYGERLGLQSSFERPGLVGFASGQSGLVVYQTASAGTAKNTVAVWRVRDLRGLVGELRGRGVAFEDYDFGDGRTVGGILEDADGSSNAWFTDSEGNVLALSEDLSQPLH
jgi:catechol 2,3-dioxygenase-like lactoylglutathione lyase family enzyme